jgi:hypothetical protein
MSEESDTTEMTDAEVFTAAADLFEADNANWRQGRYREFRKDGSGRQCFCLIGGLCEVTNLYIDAAERRFLPKISVALGGNYDYFGDGYLDGIAWNDDPDRTVDEVVALLRKAASQ